MIKVAVAHREELTRRGLNSILGEISGVRLVASVKDGSSALSACRDSCVDVLVVDVQLPPESGLAVVRTLVDEDLATRFVAIGTTRSLELFRDMMDHGVTALLLTNGIGANSLSEVIASVVESPDKLCISPELTKSLIQVRRNGSLRTDVRFTSREEDVIRQLMEGRSNKDIAMALSIAPNTARNYVERVKEKIGVRTRSEAVSWFWRTRQSTLPPR